MAIFGIYGRQRTNAALAPGPEPVWVNGVMGVYNPDTGEFVPSTSPLFDQTCDLIQRRRDEAMGNPPIGGPMVYHHWNYYPGSNVFSYSSGDDYQSPRYIGGAHGGGGYGGGGYAGGASGLRSADGISSHFGSSRGGIGETGHSFGGAHS